MKKKQNIIALALIPITLCFQVTAQVATNRPQDDTKFNLRVSENRNTVAYAKLNEPVTIEKHAVAKWLLSNVLKAGNDYSLQLEKENTDRLGFTHLSFQEMYKGIPVEYGVYKAHLKNGRLQSANGEFYDNIKISATPTVSKKEVFQNALKNFGAEKYVNDSTYNLAAAEQKGTLAIIKVENDFHLTYKFDIFSEQPFKRECVFADANSGKIISSENKICNYNSNGTAVTAYNGTQSIITDSISPTVFHLRDTTRGKGIFTLNQYNSAYLGGGADFTNTSNYWNSSSLDRYAYDAHYGAEMTYDFYYNKFGRNSYDNAGQVIDNEVHYSTNYAGAFSYYSRVIYGDGDVINYYPFTSLEIVGHEMTHLMIAYSAGLVATGESASLNESLGDMFGNTIRFTYNPAKATWLCGDQVVVPNGTGAPARNMSDPNSFFQPDTYLGKYWSTNATVNSGVPNYWYYLLSTGGSGVNDLGNSYSVNAIGMNDAIAIAYRMFDSYLTPNSNFADARFYSITAATDLFGDCSNQVYQVARAWYAVGVGDTLIDAAHANFYAVDSFYCATPAIVSFINTSAGASTFYWDFGDGTFSTDTSPTHTYLNTGNYNVKLVVNGSGFCVGADSITKTNCVSVNNVQLPQPASCTPVTKYPISYYGIYSVAFGGINNISQGSDFGYEDFTCYPVTNIIAGDPIPILITTTSYYNIYESVKVFLDYDNSATFDSSAEMIFKSENKKINHTGLIYTPASPVLNTPLRLRVIDVPSSVNNSNGCDTLYTGQAEDYTITFVATTQKPVPDFTSNVTTVAAGDTINFIDLTVKGATSWHWEFAGGFPAVSNQRNPTVLYSNPGNYNVKLIATNSFGTDSIIKSVYIHVVTTSNMCDGHTKTSLIAGTIYASGGLYGGYNHNEHCRILIDPGCAANITLSVTYFDADYQDYLRVYDGTSTDDQLILQLTGNNTYPVYTSAYSGKMLITWESGSYSYGYGFTANWTSVLNTSIPPVAAFSVSNSNAPLNAPVQFTDQSTQYPDKWNWDFGDGTFSTLQNPSHNFLTSGIQTITLVVGNCISTDTITLTINVQQPAVYSNTSGTQQVTLGCNDSTTVQIKIKNNGAGDLFLYSDTSHINDTKKVLVLFYQNSFTTVKKLLDSLNNYYANYTYDTVSYYHPEFLNDFQTRLEGKDILLIANTNSYGYNPYVQITPLVTDFVNNGGTVILQSSLQFPDYIYSLGLFTGNSVGTNYNPLPVVVSDTTNNLMDGISSNFLSPAGIYFQTITDADKVQLVSYFGYDVVAYRRIGRGKVIYAGFDNAGLTYETNRILANAIKYSDIYPLAPFVSINPYTGTVSAGDSLMINLTFNSTGYVNGTYNSYVLIYNNDTMHPVDSIPVSMIVNGNATVNLSDTCLQFGTVYQNAIAQKTLTVENTGCDSLHITSTNITNAAFSVSPTSLKIPPHSSADFIVSFNSAALNSFNATLTFFNNVKDTSICLSAQTNPAPQIALSNNSIHVNLNCKDSATVPVYIHNNGGDTLQFQIAGCGNNAPVKVLALLYGVDTANEYHNLISGINQYFTNYILDTTYTRSSSKINNLLLNYDVLLILQTAVLATDTPYTPVFKKFMDNGGTILLVGGGGYNYTWAFKFGLFKQGSYYSSYSGTIDRMDSTDVITDSIPRFFNSTNNPPSYNIADTDKVELLSYKGNDVFTYRNIAAGRAYYIGSDFGTINNYFARMTAAAIKNVKAKIPSWVNPTPLSGAILSGDSTLINLSFHAGTLAVGNYNGCVLVHSNDPLKPIDSIAVSITVSGQPEIALSDPCFDFGTIVQYKSGADSILVLNAGCDSLIITSASVNNSAYTLLPFDSVIGPFSSAKFKIIFNPLTAGNFSALLTILNNSHDTSICINGICKQAPQTSFSADSLNASLSCNDSVIVPFYVVNKGGDSLSFSALNNNSIRVLAMLYGVNTTQFNTIQYSGIQYYFKNYKMDTTYTTSPVELQSRLINKDVLLIPSMGPNDTINNALFANVIQTFAARGGTVIVIGTNYPNGINRIYDYGLFTGSYMNYRTVTVAVTDTSDDILDSLCCGFTAAALIHNITNFDKIPLVTYSGFDVVTYRRIGAGKAIYFGNDFSPNNYAYNRILSNCVRYSRKAVLPSWLSILPANGLLAAGDSILINAKLKSNGIPSGNYSAYINFNTNDPLKPVDSIKANLNITGNPEITLSDSCLDFQTIIQYHTVYDTVVISNTGCDTLVIDSISKSGNAFSYTINNQILPPYSSCLITVAFHPLGKGTFNGMLTIYNNAHDTTICLTGISTKAPKINVTPDSIAVTLSCHDSINVPIVISNIGGGQLHYNISASGSNDTVNVLAVMTGVYYYNYNYAFFDSLKHYFTKFKLDTTETNSLQYLQSKMVNKDVVVFPPYVNQAWGFGSQLNYILNDFVSKGGTVIFHGGAVAYTMNNISGFFTGCPLYAIPAGSPVVADTSNYMMDSIPSTFPASAGTVPQTIMNPDKIVAASYHNYDVVTYRQVGLGKAIYFGFGSQFIYEEESRIFGNILRHANLIAFPSWFNVSSLSDSVNAADSSTVILKINSSGYTPGYYSGYLVFQSDDPLHVTDSVFITMNVTGNLTMNINKTCFDFDSIQQYATEYDTLKIYNSSCDTLRIDSISFTNNAYHLSPATMNIAPGGKGTFIISLNPQTLGSYSAWLNVYTNIIDTAICVDGNSITSPLMSFNPDSIYADLTCFDSLTIPVYIHNTNNGVLNFNINLPGNFSNKKVLIWPVGNVNSTNYINMMNGINQHFTNYSLDTSSTHSDTVLQSILHDKNILLVPPLTNNDTVNSQSFASTIQNFITYGGTVIVCGSYLYNTGNRIYDFGLFTGSYYGYDYYQISVMDATDALMDSVPLSFNPSGNAYSQNITDADKKLLAQSSLGKDVVSSKNIGLGKAIYAGFVFANSNNSVQPSQILSNAIEFAHPHNPAQFVTASADSGSVNPGDSMLVYVTVYSNNFSPGLHYDSIQVISNDPLTPVYYLPITLNVNMSKKISLSDTCINFNATALNATNYQAVTITNNSCDSVFAYSIFSNDSNFKVLTPQLTLAPDESTEVVIGFHPGTIGSFSGIITVLNNAHDTSFCVGGTSVTSPEIIISSDSLVVNLSACGDSVTVPLYVLNSGGDSLQFHINLKNDSVKVLVMLYGVDTANEYANMIYGINQYFTNYKIYKTYTNSLVELQYLLNDKDVLLIPKQDFGNALNNFSFGPLLQAFISFGGEVVVCGSDYLNSENRIYDYGFFAGNFVNKISNGSFVKMNSTDPFLTSVGSVYASAYTYYHHLNDIDKTRLVTYGIDDVVSYRKIGKGKSVYLGYDYYVYNTSANQILSNTIKYSVKRTNASWLKIDPDAGSVAGSDSTLLNVSINAKTFASGTYRDTLWIYNNDPLHAIYAYPVVMKVGPCAAFTYSQSGCSGYVSFFGSAGGTTSWQWDFGDGTFANIQSPVHLYADSGSYIVKLIACNANGCDSTIDFMYLADVSGPKNAGCQPVGTSTCCGIGIMNVSISTINNSSADATEGYKDFSCDISTSLVAGNTYTVNVTTGTSFPENVKVWIDYNNNALFDVATETILTSNTVLINHTASFVVTASAIKNIPLRMRVKDENTSFAVSPCNNPDDGQAEDYAVVILPNTSPPVANYWFTVINNCVGNYQFTNLSQNNPTWFKWYFGDGDSSSLQNPVHQYDTSGNYDVWLIAGNAFGSDTLALLIGVHALNPDFNVTGILETGHTLQFMPVATSASTYLWDFGDSNTSALQSPTHAYTTSGIYPVSLIVTDSICGVVSYDTLNIITVGINENSNLESVTVSPNPFIDEVNIKYHLSNSANVSIEIENAEGQIISLIASDEKQKDGIHTYSFKPIASGFYILKITMNGISKSFRLVKM